MRSDAHAITDNDCSWAKQAIGLSANVASSRVDDDVEVETSPKLALKL